jgi:TonB family protein
MVYYSMKRAGVGNMRQLPFRAILILAMLASACAPAEAAAIDDGQTAYNSGDYATALRLWRPLAEQGDARAQNNLGVIYENAKGVAQDINEAARWYRLAAAQGYGGAQYNLGLIYAIGRGGVQRDPLRAYMWFTLAAMSQSGNAGSLVTQTRDVFAGVMTMEQIAAASAMAQTCQTSNYRNCEPPGDLATAPAGPVTTPAVPTTSHDVTPGDYPRESVLNHESGDVTITYLVSESGSVTACAILVTSGSPRLDVAACAMARRRWRYKPATEDGKPVSIQYISKVSFARR